MGGPQTVDNREPAEKSKAQRLEEECLKSISGTMIPHSVSDLRNKKGETMEECLRAKRAFHLEERIGQTTFRLEVSESKMLVEVSSPGKLAKYERDVFIRRRRFYGDNYVVYGLEISAHGEPLVRDRKTIDRYLASKGISQRDADRFLAPDPASLCKAVVGK